MSGSGRWEKPEYGGSNPPGAIYCLFKSKSFPGFFYFLLQVIYFHLQELNLLYALRGEQRALRFVELLLEYAVLRVLAVHVFTVFPFFFFLRLLF